MLNLKDAEDAALLGITEFENWYAEFELNWNEPMMETVMLAALARIPEKVKAELAKRKPDQMNKLTNWEQSVKQGGK